MRVSLIASILLLVAAASCRRGGGPEDPPASFRIVETLSGPSEAGYGASVAFDAQDQLWVGAPYGLEGGLFRREHQVLAGLPGAFLGASVIGEPEVLVSAPGLGQILRADGTVAWQGDPGRREGQRAVWTSDGLLSIGHTGVVGPGGFDSVAQLWSLVEVRHRRGASVFAGRIDGSLMGSHGVVPGGGALGRGLAACDLSGDGSEELIVADPVRGRVQIHAMRTVSAAEELSLDTPVASHSLGEGAGLAFGCFEGGLLVGAPDRRGGGVFWLIAPLESGSPAIRIDGISGVYAGHAIGVSESSVAVGDPGAGAVLVLEPVR